MTAFAVSWCSDAEAQIPAAAYSYKRTLVRAAHSQWGLDAPVATLAAQVHQESTWRAGVESRAGAQGLAQFMPTTATWMADLYPSSLGPADPLNPGWALRAMVTYDRWLFQRIDAADCCQRWAMTLSAYNGGLAWVYRGRRLATDAGVDDRQWFDGVELFNAGRSDSNHRENRHYVRMILTDLEPIYVGSLWGEGACAVQWRYQF